MFGTISLWFSFIAIACSIVLYGLSLKNDKRLPLARSSTVVAVVGVFLTAAILLWHILNHHFEYNFVFSHTSRDLAFPFIISALWAGQEGSLLLWAMFTGIVGCILMQQSKQRGNEKETMVLYNGILFFLILLLVARSPFRLIWEVRKDIPQGVIPADGRGLNPLLQNFWMLIHPPILFLGFSLLAVPFVLAISALWRREYYQWIHQALPWLLLGITSLGAGMIMGGYWAYGTLGWGGWWGWDPIENSSLVPWLISVILLHTMMVFFHTRKLLRTNFILAILPFVFILYSTFLTRSGVLSNASVHSFASSGNFIYIFLLLWIVSFLVIGTIFFLKRFRELRIESSPFQSVSRESFVILAVLMLGIIAFVVFFGTNLPLFTHSAVEPSFYNKTILPLAVCTVLLLAMSLVVGWQENGATVIVKRMKAPFLFSIIGVFVLFIFGVKDAGSLSLIFASLCALYTSVRYLFQMMKQKSHSLGGAISHIGVALFFLAIVASGRFAQQETILLEEGTAHSALGMELTYLGAEKAQDGKIRFGVQVKKNNSSKILYPAIFFKQNSKMVIEYPDYWTRWNEDIYIEPDSFKTGKSKIQPQAVLSLKKDKDTLYAGYKFQLLRIQMDKDSNNMKLKNGKVTIAAFVEVRSNKWKDTLITKAFVNSDSIIKSQPAFIKEDTIGLALLNVQVPGENKLPNIDVGIVSSSIVEEMQHRDALLVDVSVKPFMIVLWIAAFLILFGVLLMWWDNRRTEKSL